MLKNPRKKKDTENLFFGTLNTTERYREVTRTLEATSVTFTASTTDQVRTHHNGGHLLYNSDYDNIAISAVEDICKDGTYDGDGTYNAINFDANSNTDATATVNNSVNACDDHFQGLADSFSQSLTGTFVDSATLSFSTTSENTPLTGNGLQFGYNFKKFRVSLNSHLWSAGESKLDSQLLLLDYFLPYGLYAGGGFGTAKLDTSIGSASKTAPALHFGYQHNFTNNFSLEAGLLWFGASFSLEKSAAAPEATISNTAATIPDPIVSSPVLVGGRITNPIEDIAYITFLYAIDTQSGTIDQNDRILVTRTVTPTYGAEQQSEGKPIKTTTPTKITHEIEAPTSIFIRFILFVEVQRGSS